MIDVSANGQAISENHLRYVVWQMIKADVWHQVEQVRMHPEQHCYLMENLFQSISVLCSTSMNDVAMPPLQTETLLGKRVIKDPTINEDRIIFEDDAGRVIGVLRQLSGPQVKAVSEK